jgi:hypothetical protein
MSLASRDPKTSGSARANGHLATLRDANEWPKEFPMDGLFSSTSDLTHFISGQE